MKKLAFITFILATSSITFAQNNMHNDRDHHDDKMPDKVQRSFDHDFPGSNNPSWQQQNGHWHGNYKDKNNRDVDVYYDHNGRRLSTHTRWERSQVSPAIERKIKSRYHAQDYQVYKIERPSTKPLFQISFSIGGKNKTAYMDDRGNERTYNYHY